ncbi:MucB/RseB C-terminal domain-containing protein [Halomonas cupida]|uniref:Sigma E regulatory protein, MucB/RseB n=1 Tax=Halomonas cupida TaxID=44933 RepID=A0A1M7A7G7_9GAMM|nr:MucB/RseB C-terminal domain-containing protein [Halomonas cupida]SHL38586.1 sigma E regulatory protein, MucB/RseB [Halomonas cupida]
MPYPRTAPYPRTSLHLARLVAIGLSLLTLPVVANDAVPAGIAASQAKVQTVFDCRSLKSAPPAIAPDQWFQRSVWATHCYSYQARAVRVVDDDIVTLSLVRDIEDGVESDRMYFLNGPTRSLVREGGSMRFQLGASGELASPASPSALVEHLSELYRLRFHGEGRIANRTAVVVEFAPQDGLRYGYRLWLDRVTGIPLKRALLDDRGAVLETFELVELTPPELYDGEVVLMEPTSSAAVGWSAGWLPPGFVVQPLMALASPEDSPRRHKFYSDGLATISLFVEPLEGEGTLRPGLHRLGANYAAVRRIERGDETLQAVAVGELPPGVLMRVVDMLEFASEDAEDDSAS